MRPREDFLSDQQYSRYKLIHSCAIKLKEALEKGYIVFDDRNNLITGKVIIHDTDENNNGSIVSIINDGCIWGVIEYSYGDDNHPFIEDSKEKIIELFRSYKCVHPKYVRSAYSMIGEKV